MGGGTCFRFRFRTCGLGGDSLLVGVPNQTIKFAARIGSVRIKRLKRGFEPGQPHFGHGTGSVLGSSMSSQSSDSRAKLNAKQLHAPSLKSRTNCPETEDTKDRRGCRRHHDTILATHGKAYTRSTILEHVIQLFRALHFPSVNEVSILWILQEQPTLYGW